MTPEPLADTMTRFAQRTAARGIPYAEAMIDAMETWLAMDDADQEWRQTEEARQICMPAVRIEDLPPPLAERIRAVVARQQQELRAAFGDGPKPNEIKVHGQ